MAKDGYSVLITTFVVAIVIWITWYFIPHPFVLYIAIVSSFLAVYNLWFFRDPDRVFDGSDKDIVSPADGTVIKIDKIFEDDYFHKEVTLVSIFMSVFNVHVNRFPYSGTIDFFSYRKGKFLAAFNHAASAENEQTLIGLKTEHGQLLFKQIAGLIARRIVCRAPVDSRANKGDRFGMIRYGSRVDLYFESNVSIDVELKQKVKSGKTKIAHFNVD